jgi:predicted negative regulator of RcsB-dependent stress response
LHVYHEFINALNTQVHKLLGVDCLRNRALIILLLPVLVFVFAVGWVLYWAGKRQTNEQETAQKPSGVSKNADSSEQEFVEIGLIEDLMEEELKTES